MRFIALAAAALALSSSFNEAQALPKAAKAEAVLKVGFPRGNPFAKHRLPELQIVETKSQKMVASLRAKEWTRVSATYTAALATGKTYELRWAQPGDESSFAQVPVAAGLQGTVTFRIPYVPRIRPVSADDQMATNIVLH